MSNPQEHLTEEEFRAGIEKEATRLHVGILDNQLNALIERLEHIKQEKYKLIGAIIEIETLIGYKVIEISEAKEGTEK